MKNHTISITQTQEDDNNYSPFDDSGDAGNSHEEPVGDKRVDILMAGRNTFVSFATFLEIKYGMKTIEELNKNPFLKPILSNYLKCVITERKLAAEGKISDDVDDETKELIKEHTDYITYVGQTTIVTISLEKTLGVAAKLYSNFVYVNKAMSSSFKFISMGQTLEMTLKELVERLQEEYRAVGKVLVIMEFADGYNEDVANLYIKKRYAQTNKPVPANLVALKEIIRTKLAYENSPYLAPRHIQILANMLTDQSNTGYPEPTSKSEIIVNGSKLFAGRTVANIEDIMNLSYCKKEEEELLATQICTLLKIDAKKLILEMFARLASKAESATLDELGASLGHFNLGWYSVSTSKTDELSVSKAQYKKDLELKFASKPHIFLYLVSPVHFIFVEDPKGRRFSTAGVLLQFLHVLPKLYHYLQIMAQMHIGTVTQLRNHAAAIVNEVVRKLSRNEKVQKNLAALLMVNVALWTRVTTYSVFAVVKSKHMPSRVITDDKPPEEDEGAKVEDFGKDDVI